MNMKKDDRGFSNKIMKELEEEGSNNKIEDLINSSVQNASNNLDNLGIDANLIFRA